MDTGLIIIGLLYLALSIGAIVNLFFRSRSARRPA
jgi:hypothetical protein